MFLFDPKLDEMYVGNIIKTYVSSNICFRFDPTLTRTLIRRPSILALILQHQCSSDDAAMQQQNSYYKDLIQGKVLQPLIVTPVLKSGFQNYMKRIGKLGGQNKTPRLSNDRKIADALSNVI